MDTCAYICVYIHIFFIACGIIKRFYFLEDVVDFKPCSCLLKYWDYFMKWHILASLNFCREYMYVFCWIKKNFPRVIPVPTLIYLSRCYFVFYIIMKLKYSDSHRYIRDKAKGKDSSFPFETQREWKVKYCHELDLG